MGWLRNQKQKNYFKVIKIEDRVTDTHVYFWGDPTLSNWGPTKFEYMGHVFFNSEQAFMWKKAITFEDQEIANKILETHNPRVAKDLGREVKGYDDKVWNELRYDVMVEVNLHKFLQSPEKKKTLLSTRDKILVEGSPHDKVWGVGIHWADEKILDEKNWKGENLLGKALMEVRNRIKS